MQQRIPSAGQCRCVGLLTIRARLRHVADTARVAASTVSALLLASSVAQAAAPPHSLADIQQAAEQFVVAGGTTSRAVAMPLDRRLRLARCDQPLETFLRPGSRVSQRTIVGVRCPGNSPWKVYVPVNLVTERRVVVLKTPLPRGHQLTPADLKLVQRDVSRQAGGYATDIQQVVGYRLKQSLRADAIVSQASLAKQTLVRRGQTVTLQADNSSVAIRVAGKALMDGALGQRIRVRNSTSGRIVEGLVRSPELVEVLVH